MPQEDRKPACVKACPTGARLFGDVKDPDSEVSIAIRERGGYSLMPEWQTKPANQYLPRRDHRGRGHAAPPLRSAGRADRRDVDPAFSVVFFTTLAGAAQGLVVALALGRARRPAVGPGFTAAMLAVAAAMLVVGLGCSFLHLGRPERAWRAATMWRTSWLSREVIVLPAFIAVVVLWWAAVRIGRLAAVDAVRVASSPWASPRSSGCARR